MNNSILKIANNKGVEWGLIFAASFIIITFTFEFLHVDQSTQVKYLCYIPFVIFLTLAQVARKKQFNDYLTFNQTFHVGFIYSISSALIVAVFVYFYLTLLSPEVLEQSIVAQQNKLFEQGISASQIDSASEITRKYGPIIKALGTGFGLLFLGSLTSLISAAFLKRNKSPYDIEEI